MSSASVPYHKFSDEEFPKKGNVKAKMDYYHNKDKTVDNYGSTCSGQNPPPTTVAISCFGNQQSNLILRIRSTNWSERSSRRNKVVCCFACGFFLLFVLIISIVLGVLVPRRQSCKEDPSTGCTHVPTTTTTIPTSFVGQSFYLPDVDVYSPTSNGINIFKPLPARCYQTVRKRETSNVMNKYSHLYEFYKKIASDSGLSVAYVGRFTLGGTLRVKTSSISTGYVDVKGASIDVHTYVKSTFIDRDCVKSRSNEFTEDFMKAFDSLPPTIDRPWLTQSWQQYEIFLRTFGSHFVNREFYGATVRQWTFSKASQQYSETQLGVKACIDFGFGKIGIQACSGVTKKTADLYKKTFASSRIDIKGATDKTRNRFLIDRSEEALEQILNEGRESESPVDQKYMAIWDALMMKFYNDEARYGKAQHLMQFYFGFKDFGCTLQTSGGHWKLRSFEYLFRSATTPVFQCVLINPGCHSNDDCNLGGAGTVTYCHGPSCFEYKSPLFGNKAKSVVHRSSREGSFDEGINNSCYYQSPFHARCNYQKYGNAVIWKGGSKSI